MNIALAYDCLYPYTIGGAEKWIRGLAERLAARHRVTVLTRRQWGSLELPVPAANLEVVAVSGSGPLYVAGGRRRIGPTLAYGLGLFAHLLRNRRRYDVVHVASFPFFSVLGARAAERLGGPAVLVDWLEIWSRESWRDYLGPVGGRVGAAIQNLCVRLSNHAVVHSMLHARRLEAEGCPSAANVLAGMYGGPLEASPRGCEGPLVVFAGRHIPEKGVALVPQAIAIARARIPGLEAILFGDGPERTKVVREIERLGLGSIVRSVGFTAEKSLRDALGRATCIVLPSRREGFGLVIVEAAAFGTPAIVLRAPESAAPELIEPGENGFVIDGAEPERLAEALVAVHLAGDELRSRTLAWFRRNVARLTIDASVAELEGIYRRITSMAIR